MVTRPSASLERRVMSRGARERDERCVLMQGTTPPTDGPGCQGYHRSHGKCSAYGSLPTS